ncbi:hypothetical protein DESC_370149 [Desulfosarcina cetonica]|nr:hypothetical protein DESC_370149 [Desulfosarcina cetonica]
MFKIMFLARPEGGSGINHIATTDNAAEKHYLEYDKPCISEVTAYEPVFEFPWQAPDLSFPHPRSSGYRPGNNGPKRLAGNRYPGLEISWRERW